MRCLCFSLHGEGVSWERRGDLGDGWVWMEMERKVTSGGDESGSDKKTSSRICWISEELNSIYHGVQKIISIMSKTEI